MRKNLNLGARLAPLGALVVLSAGLAVAQSAAQGPQVIEYGAPLLLAAETLGNRYAMPVTYEDPVLLWPGDMTLRDKADSTWMPYLDVKKRLIIPNELTPELTPSLDVPALKRVLDAYNTENPGAPRFRVERSAYGLHILPDSVRDASGKWVPATTPLDTRITMTRASRTAFEHVEALCQAVAQAFGVVVEPYGDRVFAGLFAANGIVPPKNEGIPYDMNGPVPVLPLEKKRPYMFEWGAANATAREALVSLLDQSATTMTWRMDCVPNPVRAKTSCLLSLLPLEVTVTCADGRPCRQTLTFDRCTKCPPLPAPASPRRQQ